MKNWFPFSDYDFYGYLVSGFFLLFIVDYAITGGSVLLKEDWTFIEIVLVVFFAYTTGQVIAIPSSIIIEHFLTKHLLKSPMSILMGTAKFGLKERCINKCFVGRYYEPFSPVVRESILSKIEKLTHQPRNEFKNDVETIFQIAYPHARSNEDARARMDDFRNQYGFARNVSFTSFLGVLIVGISLYCGIQFPYSIALLMASIVLACGMYCRFLKFYSAFSAEMLRAFNCKVN